MYFAPSQCTFISPDWVNCSSNKMAWSCAGNSGTYSELSFSNREAQLRTLDFKLSWYNAYKHLGTLASYLLPWQWLRTRILSRVSTLWAQALPECLDILMFLWRRLLDLFFYRLNWLWVYSSSIHMWTRLQVILKDLVKVKELRSKHICSKPWTK